MKVNKILLIGLVSGGFILNSFGQQIVTPSPPWRGIPSGTQGNIPQPIERRERPLTEEQKAALAERRKNRKIARNKSQAPAIYYEKYKDLLKNDDVELIRIYVDLNCDKGKTVSVAELERCSENIPIQGGGSYYSFRLKKYR